VLGEVHSLGIGRGTRAFTRVFSMANRNGVRDTQRVSVTDSSVAQNPSIISCRFFTG
jgi:hypothetical protein